MSRLISCVFEIQGDDNFMFLLFITNY